MTESDSALLCLLEALQRRGYRFVTPTPVTHGRVVARPDRQSARDLCDILGWSLPFAPGGVDAEIGDLLERAGVVEAAGGGLLRSTIRVSSLGGRLFLHSAWPTEAADSVFFGPDSYRFADLIAAEVLSGHMPAPGTIVDIGTGAGVGAVVAFGLCPQASVWMTDINRAALRFAAINARAAGAEIRAVESDGLDAITGPIDLALANPPYIVDTQARTYRDGGGMLGGQISVEMARMAIARLAPLGRLILYTGSAIVDGEDMLERTLLALADDAECDLRYRELDPDVFGEELDAPAYAEVDRIAVVAAIFTRR